jgi:hypothetical protein
VLEIGIAISFYGLFVMITIMIQLGVEYPLLRKIKYQRFPCAWGRICIGVIRIIGINLTVFFFIANFHQNLINQGVVNDLI